MKDLQRILQEMISGSAEPTAEDVDLALEELLQNGYLELAGEDPESGEPLYRLTERGRSMAIDQILGFVEPDIPEDVQ